MFARFAGAVALVSTLTAVALGSSAQAASFGAMRSGTMRSLPPSVRAQLRDFAKSPSERGVATDIAYARGLRDLGHAPAGKPVQVGFLMAVRNKAELEQLTLLQSTRSSPLFHHYLSKAQWNAYFAPDALTYRRTIVLLEHRGFRIAGTYGNRGMIQAIAPVATVERYFQTNLHMVAQPGRGVRMINTTPAVMPSELRTAIVSISGLHTIVTMTHPIHFADRSLVLHSAQYQRAFARVRAEHAAAVLAKSKADAARRIAQRGAGVKGRVRPDNVPTPLASNTPAANPMPEPTEAAGDPATDYVASIGAYDPTIYANAYDYPVQHGYGGRNHVTASVIEADYLDTDAALQVSTFGIPRTGKNYRYCGDVTGGPNCDNTIGGSDPEGESTLDAMVIISLAPAADFYEYISPAFDDAQIEGSYELALDQDVADVVNSSFGGCETDDPSFGYAANYLAMEGAALGMTFSASTGDTGATNCGTYATNGAPQTEINISIPSGSPYFTAVGGTDFYQLESCAPGACYTRETGWTDGGGGSSVIYPIPVWQEAAVDAQTVANEVSTTMRNTPDVVFTADELPPGVGMDVFYNGNQAAIGGTSVGSPMFTAMQTTINEAQNSRNGWVTPGLYAAFDQFNTLTSNYAFRDITGGTNTAFAAVPGYDDQTGLGSPLGWELAGVENGYPGAPNPVTPKTPPPEQSPTPSPLATPSPVPTVMPTPHAVGTANDVTTIAGNGNTASVDGTGTAAQYANPSGVVYVPSGISGQSLTDNYLFITDYTTGYLRGLDLTSLTTTSYNTTTWNNMTRASAGDQLSNLDGLVYLGTMSGNSMGLYVLSAGDNSFSQVTLPTTVNPAATPFPALKALSGGPAGAVSNAAGNEVGVASFSDGTFHLGEFAQGVTDDLVATSALPVGGNFGVVLDNSTPANYLVVTSKLNKISLVSDMATASTVTAFPTTGVPLNSPREITKIGTTYYIANCGGNDILKMTTAGVITVLAGDGNAGELPGYNTGAEFKCPFGITTDGTNLFVTDFGGNTVREITNVQ